MGYMKEFLDKKPEDGLFALFNSDGVTYICGRCGEPVGYYNGFKDIDETGPGKECLFCGNIFYDERNGWKILDKHDDV